MLYKTSIRPVLVYALPIWFPISPTVMKEFEIFERKILRLCVGKNFKYHNKRFSNRYIYEASKVTPISVYAMRLIKNYANRAFMHSNLLIQECVNKESNFTWENTNYVSPLGINLYMSLEDIQCPEFYVSTSRGIHRG